MNRVREILGLLRAESGYVSGDQMAAKLSVSRTAIWKCLKQLEQIGYVFERLKGKGYRLHTVPDRLYPWEVERYIHTGFIGRPIIYRESLDSTNAVAFKLALSGCTEGTCVIAETQDSGRGRLQRKWYSPRGKNIYLSVVLRPELHPSEIYPVTFLSSLAVHDTLRFTGIEPRLKWPNDVLVGNKKISGTLIELSTEADAVRFVVIGIGININMEKADMDAEIQEKATSLLNETKNRYERSRICGMLLNNLERYYDVVRQQGVDQICRLWENCAGVKGSFMEIRQMDRVYRGVCEGIDRDGAILLNENGRLLRVIAGDVTS
jgi:BirA family biotin operon repressor/biotin-[acetyl-CoA-carboxylase] ligase